MNGSFIGEEIRQRRRALGLTQVQLGAGICDNEVISRLERGESMPSRERLSSILQRLNLPEARFYAFLTKNEDEARVLQREIRADVIAFEQAEEAGRPWIRARAIKMLNELEALLHPDDRVTRQFILSEKATLGGEEGPYGPEERMALLMEALRLTVPKFDADRILSCRYSVNETTLINKIAVTYAAMGDRKKAIGVYSQLLRYLEKNTKNLSSYANQFCLVAYNYANTLAREESYAKAIQVAEQGRQVCRKYNDCQFRAGLLAILARCHFHTGNMEESRKLYLLAYCHYAEDGNLADLETIRQNMQDDLGMDAPF